MREVLTNWAADAVGRGRRGHGDGGDGGAGSSHDGAREEFRPGDLESLLVTRHGNDPKAAVAGLMREVRGSDVVQLQDGTLRIED